ncbi:MAG: peptide chain release factor N(5)-glutamine methyltransferase [Aquabacterium sp.]|nr:peptide chain release factor N(5)-glutamine methyltransferase [Aquabacterium sp.]MBP6615610.1 peptide chain release factor N(5)-glutamine methyltransferase [Aquabacterium sp.]
MSDANADPTALTVAQALAQARSCGVDRLDAHLLLGHVLGRSRTWLLSHDTDLLDPEAQARYLALLARRAEGEPAAYLLGDKEFFGLNLRVTPDTLIPRPDTETLVHWALEHLPADQPRRVLDLGTGSGAIALALAHERPLAEVTAVDASPGALQVALDNASALGLRLRGLLGSWFTPVAGERFDLIVSNPPYIAEGDPHMAALRFEPETALTAGPDGLDDLRQIIDQAPHHLAPGGWLLLEHGFDQANAVMQLLQNRGFLEVSTRFDLGPQARCTGGRLPT